MKKSSFRLASLVIFVVMILSVIYFVISGIDGTFKGSHVFTDQGSAKVPLEKGEYTFFIENDSQAERGGYHAAVRDPQGSPVSLSPQKGSYSMSGRRGKSFASFKVESAGLYEISAGGLSEGSRIVLVRNFIQRLFQTMIFAFAGLGGGIVMLFLVFR
jgi:hypothetical protein